MTIATPVNKEGEVNALKRAIAVERRALYADFQGKRSTFSQFMRHTADRLCRRYPLDARWATIRGLFRQYPNMDVATRISIVHRVDELLAQPDPDVRPAPSSPAVKHNLNSPQAGSVRQKPTAKPSEKSVAAKPAVTKTAVSTPTVVPPKVQLPKSDASKPADKHFSQDPAEVDVKYVKGVGPKMAELLNNMNIFTVEDLIRHYPRRHLDFLNRQMIRDIEPGQEVTIFGTITTVGAFQSKKTGVSVVTVGISDGSGRISITRFIGGKGNKYLLERYKAQFPKGAQVLASGTVEIDRYSRHLQLRNAEVELLGVLGEGDHEINSIQSLHAGRLVPVYSLTEGLGLRHLRNVIHNALETYVERIPDLLPDYVRGHYDLMPLHPALWEIHFPEQAEQKDLAQKRLVFDELFAIQLQLAYRRRHSEAIESGLALAAEDGVLLKRFRENLPFTLTSAQERVFKEIAYDLAAEKPMHRLVQGDVGSGKTVVALMAFLVAIENGYQGAMMAPTEILAEQHYRQFQRWLTPLGLRVALFVGKQGQKERREIQQALLAGQIHIAVGTHALIQDGVDFKNLGLIIIDEQHRFGVKQRARLKSKGQNPELLTMTATPIPRTLALTVHGDLDVSEIDELPPGRKPIETKLVRPSKRKDMWEFVDAQINEGRQAYIVFPLIDESETLSAKAATAEYEKLKSNEFKHRRLGLMHGKLKPQEKDEIMDQFRAGKFDILVSTTVIEVGVDVPNASVMVIENADRFGLAQLHQLRGRVGRGSDQSYCYLVSDSRAEATRQRLEIMEQTNDGFVVAEKDLELRGPGEFLGYKQSGLPDLLLADLVRDAKILEEARQAAIALINEDPDLDKHPILREKIKKKLASQEADLLGSG